jgi:uncharacterized membrane protein
MLIGAPATQQCVQFLNSVDGLLPSDLDGATPPPAGSPNYVMTYTSNYLRLWKFHVDFANPANTAMTGPYVMAVNPFSEACGGSGACIPQLGTTQLLSSVGDRLMYRLAYRNFGDHEALVVNHSVATANAVGVRWYELRDLSGYPTVYQQGTYAPDSNYRWMGSIAMDQSGNVALGYSLSSTTMKPSIGYTGRAPGDPVGTMGTETIIVNGSGAQTVGESRWGEYTSMSIDPVDDCTFWYTNQYLQTDGTFNWSTRIASFQFPSCGTAPAPDFALSATPPSNAVGQGSNASYAISLSALNGFTGNVDLSLSGLPTGATSSFNPASVGGSGTSTLTITTTSATPIGTYTLTITGTSGSLVHSTTVTLIVAAPDFALTATPPTTLVLQGSSASYTVTVSSLQGFTGNVDLALSGLPAGAGYSFNPTSIAGSGTSTLTITTARSIPTGTYSLIITGTNGTLVHSTTVTLAILPAPDFALTATPPSNTVIQGSGTSYAVTVSPLNGFTGNVALTLSGLPAGAGYSFNPASIAGSGTSTLTVTTANSTPVGTYALTITGASGSIVHATTITLIVTAAPDFVLTATPSQRTITRGDTTTYTISVTPTGGFTGTVAFSVQGLPNSTSATFQPGYVVGSGSSVLRVNTAKATKAGIYTLTVTGTSGTLSHTATVTLAVQQ